MSVKPESFFWSILQAPWAQQHPEEVVGVLPAMTSPPQHAHVVGLPWHVLQTCMAVEPLSIRILGRGVPCCTAREHPRQRTARQLQPTSDIV